MSDVMRGASVSGTSESGVSSTCRASTRELLARLGLAWMMTVGVGACASLVGAWIGN